jgi:hypothetical protein
MPIPVEELYKQSLEEHRFASEYRLKIIRGWSTMYVALSAAFVWVQANVPKISWLIPAAGAIITLFMWVADQRHRPAIGASKEVGRNIEIDEKIVEGQRFFSKLEKGISHSLLIDIYAILLFAGLCLATGYLIRSGGAIP